MTDISFIIDGVYTKQQALELIQQLQQVIEDMYSSKKMQTVFDEHLPEDINEALSSQMQKDKIELSNTKIKTYLEEVIAAIQKVPTISIILAFNPTGKRLKELIKGFEMTLQKKFFWDISVDPGILGGAVIKYNGVYKNYSLAHKL